MKISKHILDISRGLPAELSWGPFHFSTAGSLEITLLKGESPYVPEQGSRVVLAPVGSDPQEPGITACSLEDNVIRCSINSRIVRQEAELRLHNGQGKMTILAHLKPRNLGFRLFQKRQDPALVSQLQEEETAEASSEPPPEDLNTQEKRQISGPVTSESPKAPQPETRQDVSPSACSLKQLRSELRQARNSLLESLCPRFYHTGPLVSCSPVENYPLSIITDYSGPPVRKLSLTLCQDNLLDTAHLIGRSFFGLEFTCLSIGTVRVRGKCLVSGTKAFFPFGTGILALPDLPYVAGYTVLSGTFPAMGSQCGYSQKDQAIYVSADLEPVDYDAILGFYIYPKFGAPSGFRSFVGHTYQADLGGRTLEKGAYDWQRGLLTDDKSREKFSLGSHTVPKPIPGWNTIFSSCGTTSVYGLSDPKAELQILSCRLSSLEDSRREYDNGILLEFRERKQREKALLAEKQARAQEIYGHSVMVIPADRDQQRRELARAMTFKKDYDFFSGNHSR